MQYPNIFCNFAAGMQIAGLPLALSLAVQEESPGNSGSVRFLIRSDS